MEFPFLKIWRTWPAVLSPMDLPTKKKVARAFSFFRISKTCGVIELFGPSSKVKNTIFLSPP